jgi:type I restriction enzyme, S subunit
LITTRLDLPVMSSWMRVNGRRLDCNPYLSGAFEAKVLLEQLKAKKQPLNELTTGYNGGIYNGPQFTRNYVESPKYGVPFLTSSSMLLADLSMTGLLRRKDAESAKLKHLRLEEGMTLISCSGTVGKMIYTRSDMAGMWSSQDVMKVVPDINKIPSGYLYCFLSSKFGVPIVISATYGAIIQHIEPHHIADLPVPRFTKEIEEYIHRLITSASSKRTQAILLQNRGIEYFYSYYNLTYSNIDNSPTGYSTFNLESKQLSRLDAFHYSPNSLVAANELKMFPFSKRLGSVAKVFSPKIFKRIYAEGAENGYPYYSGSELFQLYPESRGYLSKKAPGITDYIVKKNWLLIQDAGQVGGLIGRIVRVKPYADNSTVSNHLMRVIPNTVEDAAYLFTVLSSAHGYRAIVRHAFGTSIPQLESSHIENVFIPWPEEETRREIGMNVLEAWRMFDEADEEEQTAKEYLNTIIEDGRG